MTIDLEFLKTENEIAKLRQTIDNLEDEPSPTPERVELCRKLCEATCKRFSHELETHLSLWNESLTFYN